MRIADYFNGKTILITGATGFMGKALVQKILRSCPDVSTIYVVVRPKKGIPPQERWEQITKLPVRRLKCYTASLPRVPFKSYPLQGVPVTTLPLYFY